MLPKCALYHTNFTTKFFFDIISHCWSFMDKVVIITGASSGIGYATAKTLLNAGYKVYGIARDEKQLEFPYYVCDVNDTDKMKQIFEDVYSKEKRIDVVINNAGFGIAGAMEYASKEKIDAIFQTNLCAVAKISSIAIRYLKETQGRIVNISSVAGIMPIPFQACYSATKAGVLNFSRALDGEVRRFGIRVSAILPGDTKTGFTSARVVEGGDEGYDGHVTKSIKRMAKDEQNGAGPETVAKAILKVLKKKNPPTKFVVGKNYKLFVFLNRLLPTKLVDYILRKMYA